MLRWPPGLGSLRRFNTVFQDRYRLSPTALRKRLPERAAGSGITVRLGYRPPYRWEEMLDFLSVRAIAGVEVVRDGEYLRTVRIARDKSAGAGAVRGVLGSATAPSFRACRPALRQVGVRLVIFLLLRQRVASDDKRVSSACSASGLGPDQAAF